MSKRVILTLASATVLAAVVPGIAGYASAQFEALDQARRELARLQAQLQMMELTVEPAAAVRCGSGRAGGRTVTRAPEDDERQLTPPPRTHNRPWHNDGNDSSVRMMEPTLFSSIVVPAAGPEPVRARHHHH
ncbi:hypothetical protein JOL79_26195 [Microbispora sp. RL4-1S]|uniref:Uncharacterized protein n=1 Tax=Microbispora oryzae TaxID=2806554 RepID=A0A941AS38_9ACTN|nr:hypothetical protein [Microbispora oryzae]MBP2707279.1 hypothetical protein [Microbispora oryzae]